MTDSIRKAAQDVLDAWMESVSPDNLYYPIKALKAALAAPAQAAPHARDAVAWTPDTGYVFADAKNAQAAPDDVCEWTYDGYTFWGMQCNGLSNRAENPQMNMIHCYRCGKRIRFIDTQQEQSNGT